MDLQTATPAEIDAVIAEIEERRHQVLAKTAAPEKRLREMAKLARHGLTVSETEKAELEARIERLKDEAAEIAMEASPYGMEYMRRGGWERYYVVQHLHTTTRCSSFRATTRVGWLPEYSGRAEAEVVAEAGDMVCSICIPDAPVTPKRPTIPELAAEWDKRNGNDGTCPGSGTGDWKDGKVRTGYVSGNGGLCGHCGKSVSNTSRNSRTIRKHKAD